MNSQKVGQPISPEERAKRTIEHLILYGIKMMVRRDIGGRDDIDNHVEVIGKKLVGMTAKEAAEFFVAEIDKFRKGVAERQRRSVEEFERRCKNMRELCWEAYQVYYPPNTAPTTKEQYQDICEKLFQATFKFLDGDDAKHTFKQPVSPLDAHVLR